MFRAALPLLLYLGFVVLSVLAASDLQLAMFEIFLLVQMLLVFIYIVHSVRTRQDVVFAMAMLLVGLALEGALILAMGAGGLHINIPGITNRIDPAKGYGGPSYRAGGTIGSPNTAASFLSLLLAPAISVLLTRLQLWIKLLAAGAFALGGAALILTFSRGGWTASALSILIFGFFAWRRGWLSMTIPFIGFFMGAIVLVFFQELILARLSADDRGAAYARVPLMEIAFRIIRDHPLLGVGSNNFVSVLQRYVTPEFDEAWIYTVHNKYLIVWSETGIGGLMSFLGFLAVTIRRGWLGWRLNDRLLSPIALGLMSGIMGQMVHMFVDLFRSRPQVQLLWTAAALITAIVLIGKREAQDVAV
jgi:O-antigen ligase